LSGDPEKGLGERLASPEHLKGGLGLLGVKSCSRCGIFYRRSDPGALFDCGGSALAVFHHGGCTEVRNSVLMIGKKAERELRRWLVSHHHAEVIGWLGNLPKPERLLLKLVTGCEQCNASGKTHTGGLPSL
jgi:hypothetical protein